MSSPPRRLRPEDLDQYQPVYAVWELTTRCDQPCAHCGTRAGSARTRELSLDEVKLTGSALAKLGCREVTLIGGEAYLRPDIEPIVQHLVAQGLRVSMQTGGRALTLDRARRLKEAGLSAVGVSIDGPEAVHDQLRGNRGSFAAALRALDNAREVGFTITSNIQINQLNRPFLREVSDTIRDHGARAWQTQMTVPMGAAADQPGWILEPWMILDVLDTLAAIQRDAIAHPRAWEFPQPANTFNVAPGNNLGYFGPHEELLRTQPGGPAAHWPGCSAGRHVIGIESDGAVKGCPSLPTAPYVGGNVRELSLEQIWRHSEQLNFARDRSVEELWGYCRGCYYAEVCKGGCSFTAHCTLGKRGNNPFCYHRASELRREGVRERLVQKERPPGERYDFGRFEIVTEPWPSPAEPE